MTTFYDWSKIPVEKEIRVNDAQPVIKSAGYTDGFIDYESMKQVKVNDEDITINQHNPLTQLLTELAKNNADEDEAIEGYYELLQTMIDNGNDAEDIGKIEIIIAQEKEHKEILNALMEKYDKITPTDTIV